MIIANLATYPKRHQFLQQIVEAVAPQVDRLNIVLNEYKKVPTELKSFPNVNPIIPPEDLKDTGKFFPDVSKAELVLLLDDDILYPSDYVEQTVSRYQALGDQPIIASYHGSVYRQPVFRQCYDRKKRTKRNPSILNRLQNYPQELLTYKSRLADFRWVSVFYREQTAPTVVDQVASGVAIMKAKDMPPFDYMASSQKFVDVRLARWVFERGLKGITLPRTQGWLAPIRYDETIFNDFTEKNPKHVNDEIRVFAGRISNAGEVFV